MSECHSDIMIVLDANVNNNPDDFFTVRFALSRVLRGVDVTQRRVAVVTTSSDGAHVEIGFDSYTSADELATKVRGLDYRSRAGQAWEALHPDVYFSPDLGQRETQSTRSWQHV